MKLWHKTFHNNKPPLVLLHGWGFNSDIFLPIIEKFNQDYQITLIDLPGHGRSPVIKGGFDEWIEAILMLIPLNTTIIGWSLGGLLAIKLAQLTHAKHLHLVASTPCFIKKDDWSYGIDLKHFLSFQKTLNINTTQGLKNFIRLQLVPKVYLAKIFNSIEKYPAHINGLNTGLDILVNADLRYELQQINQPTSATLGQRDTLVSAKIKGWFEQHNMNCNVLNSGHLPFMNQNFKL